MAYFRKEDPRVSLVLMDGSPILFEAVSWDIGVYPPEGRGISENLANQIRLCIANQRGAITEISQQEYQGLIDAKKNSPERMKRPEREELKKTHRPEGNIVQFNPHQTSPSNIPQNGVAAAPAVVKTAPVLATTPLSPGVPSAPTEIPRPTAIRREN